MLEFDVQKMKKGFKKSNKKLKVHAHIMMR